MLCNEIIKQIKSRIKKHHKLYDLTIKGEYWEEILAKSIIAIGGTTDWTPERTHSVGRDQTCSWSEFSDKKISNKSGIYTISSSRLKISGSRSTSFESLEEKIKYFSDKQEDLYFCLATSSIKKDPNYYLFYFDSSLLDYHNALWQPNYDKTDTKMIGWKCNTDYYDAWIKNDMSGQLWTHIKLDKANLTPIVLAR
jgi:hypothetical protein